MAALSLVRSSLTKLADFGLVSHGVSVGNHDLLSGYVSSGTSRLGVQGGKRSSSLSSSEACLLAGKDSVDLGAGSTRRCRLADGGGLAAELLEGSSGGGSEEGKEDSEVH